MSYSGHERRPGASALSSKLVPVEGEARWLDRFELVAELATGGMATVFLARISGAGGFQRFVGIKRLHPHLAREPEFIDMFIEEARLAARIHHPNVVPILEIGTSDQGYYIVMEYVEGHTLANLVARSVQGGARVPVSIATRILIDVLGGLHAAHELADDDGAPLGIVHRDVSPQNILIGIDGSARLTDFGVARATSKLSTTRTGQLKGKLAYMAPEQARGAKDIDRRADLFAAGVVFWETLEGRRLFKGDGEADTLNKVLHDPIPRLKSAEPTVPPAIEALLDRALDRERMRRFPTAAAFALALERTAGDVGEVATHKDVAAYLDQVLGAETAKQRETVRAWIARAEPGRPKSVSVPPPGPTGAAALPRFASRSSSPERTPPTGPSVASAVISNHAASPSKPPLRARSSAPPPQRRAVRRGLLVVTALTIGLVVAMRWARTHDAASGLSAPPSATKPAGAPGVPATVAVPVASLPASASAGPVPDASLASPERSPPVAAEPSPRPSHAPVAPNAPKATAPPGSFGARVPDDISQNPYR